MPGNKPNLREEPWTHLHGPASLWPAGQHGYPPGMFFGRKAVVPGGTNTGNDFNTLHLVLDLTKVDFFLNFLIDFLVQTHGYFMIWSSMVFYLI